MIGFFPVGIAYGILMADAGYNFVWSALSSLFVYAGSLQMLAVSFLINGTPLFTVAITALLLNSRHIFYGISFISEFREYGFWRYFIIYGLTDENYSLLCSYKDMGGVSRKWVNIFSTALIWLYWIVFSALGGIIGQFITFSTDGVSFALTALFVVILLEQLKSEAPKLPALIAFFSAVISIFIIGAESFLLPSLLATVAILLISKKALKPTKTRKGSDF